MAPANEISMDAATEEVWSETDGIFTLKEQLKIEYRLFSADGTCSHYFWLALDKSSVKHCGA